MSSTLKSLRALSDPTRLRIVALLEKDELSVNELQEITRLGQSRISTHLGLLSDCDLLYIESVFSDADRDQAARKNHLTARQAGEIARRLRAKRVVPFHFSPRYRGTEAALVAEIDEAAGRSAGPAPS